jgi:ubiquinone/menaquinone biosynthesis C-methylase UbiE
MRTLEYHTFLICPRCKSNLIVGESRLSCESCGSGFDTTVVLGDCLFTSFAQVEQFEIAKNESFYDASSLNSRYRNFLNWLFLTFKTDEDTFRESLFSELNITPGMRILITGIGNGDDLYSLLKMFPEDQLEIYAQDISLQMCQFTITNLKDAGLKIKEINVSNASYLPYFNDYFDVVFHFGGINWMSEKKLAIDEMVRVAKNSGQIAIIDESVGSWLRDTDYGIMMINNNSLWAAKVPIDLLPINVNHVQLKFILENCFYLLKFQKDNQFPSVDIDVKHIGPRGGSIRSRFLDFKEGVDRSLGEPTTEDSKLSDLLLNEH